MSDLEIVKVCAGMMGLELEHGDTPFYYNKSFHRVFYNPLLNKAQCFELIEKFKLVIAPDGSGWMVGFADNTPVECSTDLARAICTCVAKMKGKP